MEIEEIPTTFRDYFNKSMVNASGTPFIYIGGTPSKITKWQKFKKRCRIFMYKYELTRRIYEACLILFKGYELE